MLHPMLHTQTLLDLCCCWYSRIPAHSGCGLGANPVRCINVLCMRSSMLDLAVVARELAPLQPGAVLAIPMACTFIQDHAESAACCMAVFILHHVGQA